ncbi:hypothetical protein SpCBS45565_g07585 [Spizellomyces sp. 'palustris']|nr:hypothetical protein SpCBS45565_g07585 [Spizellomyces sp. 'palustris']
MTTPRRKQSIGCAFCRSPIVRRPQAATFQTSAGLLARKARGAQSDEKPRVTDYRIDELADEILDEIFEKAPKKKQSGERTTAVDSNDRPWDRSSVQRESEASKLSGERVDDRGDITEEVSTSEILDQSAVDPLAKGSDALPRSQYAQYDIESAEDREARRTIEQKYYDVNEPARKSLSDDWYVDEAYNIAEEAPKESDFVPRWMRGIEIAEQRSQGMVEEEEIDLNGPLRLREVVDVLREEKGTNLVAIDMRSKCDYADYMIIVEGRSKKQIYALADAVRRKAKHRVGLDPSLPPNLTIEGTDSEDWMVLDTGRFIIHCFTPEARARYNLEGLWTAIKDPLLALVRDADIEQQQLAEAGRGWDSRPQEEFRIKDIERRHVLGEEEVVEQFNAPR